VSDPLPWVVAISTSTLGAGGWWLTRRKERTDAGSTLVQMGLQIAQRADVERAEAASELAAVTAELVTVKEQLAKHARKIKACEGDRELLMAIATKAGWDLKDLSGG
jgi:hypothetical protein